MTAAGDPSLGAYFQEFFLVPKILPKVLILAAVSALCFVLRGRLGSFFDRLRGRIPALLFLTFALGLVLRLGWVIVSVHAPSSEEVPLLTMSQDLAAGKGFVYEGQPTARRSAGYVFFLSLFYRLGLPLLAIQLVNAVLSALLIPILYLIGREIRGPLTGYFAGLLWAVYPTSILAASLVLDEHACLPLLFLGLYFVLRAFKTPALRPLLWAGICWGAGATARPIPSTLPFAAFLALWIARYDFGQALKRVLIVTALIVACAAPWALRNWVKLGAPVFYCISQYGFYWANNSSYDVRFPVNPTPQAGEDPEVVKARDLYHAGGKGEIIYSKVTMRKAWEWIRQNPCLFAVKTSGKAFRLLGFSQEEWAWAGNVQAIKPGSALPGQGMERLAVKLQNWFYVFIFLSALGGIAVFAGQALRGRLNGPFLLCLLAAGQIFFMTILYLAHLKYRYMLDPFFMLGCAFFFSVLASRETRPS